MGNNHKGYSPIEEYEQSNSTLPENQRILLDLSKKVKPELLQMMHWSLEEIRRFIVLYKRRTSLVNLNYSLFNKIINQKEYNSETIYKHFIKGTSSLNIFEFVMALLLFAQTSKESRIKFLFTLFDLRNTGRLNKNEFYIAYKSIVNGYIKVTGSQLHAENIILKNASFLFKQIDYNPDSSIEYNELTEFLDKNENVAHIFMLIIPDKEVFNDFKVFIRFPKVTDGKLRYIEDQMKQSGRPVVLGEKNKSLSVPIYKRDLPSLEFRNKKKNVTRQNKSFDSHGKNNKVLSMNSIRSPVSRFANFKMTNLNDGPKPLKSFSFFVKLKSKHMKKLKEKLVKHTEMHHASRSPVNFHPRKNKESSYTSNDSNTMEESSLGFGKFLKEADNDEESIQFRDIIRRNDMLMRYNTRKYVAGHSHRRVIISGGLSISKDEVVFLLDVFLRISQGNDRIDMTQFAEEMRKYPYMKRIMISMFKYIDFNSTGDISFNDLLKATYPSVMRNPEYSSLVEAWVSDYNSVRARFKKEESIQSANIKQPIPSYGIERLRSIFATFDKSENGFIDYITFKHRLDGFLPDLELRRIFERSNRAADGKLTFADFVKMVVSEDGIFDVSDQALRAIQAKYMPFKDDNNSKNIKKTEGMKTKGQKAFGRIAGKVVSTLKLKN